MTSAEFTKRWQEQTDAHMLGVSERAVLRSGVSVRIAAAEYLAHARVFECITWVHPRRRPYLCLGPQGPEPTRRRFYG